jgi:hypothetical protein
MSGGPTAAWPRLTAASLGRADIAAFRTQLLDAAHASAGARAAAAREGLLALTELISPEAGATYAARREATAGEWRVAAALEEAVRESLTYLIGHDAAAGGARVREHIFGALSGIERAREGGLRSARETRGRFDEIADRLGRAESASAEERVQSEERIERITRRIEETQREEARRGAVSGERIRQVIERLESAERAQTSDTVISRERLRQVIERLETAERAEGDESAVSRERIRQVIERLEAVEEGEARQDAVSRERIRQIIERLESADSQQRQESVVTRERIRQVIERLEEAAQGEGRDSSLTRARVEEVVERIGGQQAESIREEYAKRRAREQKPWYAPFTLALTRAFSAELLRDRTGAVRGDAQRLEETVAPVMRERYRTMTDSFTERLLERGRARAGGGGESIFDYVFRRGADRGYRGFPRADSARDVFSGYAPRNYASAPPASPELIVAERGERGAKGDRGERGDISALPAWARDFIKDSFSKPDDADARRTGARGISPSARTAEEMTRLRPRSAGEDAAVMWTAPRVKPADMSVVRSEKDGADSGKRPAAMTEAEIRRMADKVYGILESRVSLERRRLGY